MTDEPNNMPDQPSPVSEDVANKDVANKDVVEQDQSAPAPAVEDIVPVEEAVSAEPDPTPAADPPSIPTPEDAVAAEEPVAPAEEVSPSSDQDAVPAAGEAAPEAPAVNAGAEPAAETIASETAAGDAVASEATEAAAAGAESVEEKAPPEVPAKKPKKESKGAAAEEPKEEPKSENMDWYILKVQSNREDSIREGLTRRVAIAGLDYFFGDIIVPTEKVTEFKGGKKRVLKRKLYPGYIVVNMEINDDTWFLVRETPGIGDFTGAAGHPTPMLDHEVSRILAKHEEKSEKAPKLKIAFNPGDQVKINEGTFENFEGEVEAIDQINGRVTVMINIFGRSTPVELEYWQLEAV